MKVIKRSRTPFKSGFQINTVRGELAEHPVTGNPCYLFEEDETYVEQRTVREATPEDFEKFSHKA